jgi:hypothetical protein
MLGGALEDAPRFVFDQQVGGRPSARLVLEIKIAERPPVLVAHDEAGSVHLVDGPGRIQTGVFHSLCTGKLF